ncbi:unnamed protein product [Acanthoscelides obtectus]|uniref:receptor protein-tyrosine kinase n=2 Tax=Acanthoscelides obtectus TaxID=200917 RepID=A0A9P0NRP3_ACAOB|nr:unnamed protein product [Acanthoscelides obtectus]CAK1665758.1 Vascular endothelial growth factor receptor 1 [Acanthoscelides obtectus]
MALVNSAIVFSFVYIFGILTATYGDIHFEKPQILSEYEYTVEANENHEIFCQGNKPLKWSVPEPNIEENGSSSTSFRTQEEKPESPKFKYGLRLFISNMTYHYVGFYYCHYEDTYKEDEDNSASVYLFVHDEKHLAVEPLVSVLAVQYQTAVIPCRPTSKDVEVTLHDEYGNEVSTADYNPKTGFSFFYVDAAQLGYHYCEFTRNDTSFTVDFFIDAAVSHLDTPEVTDLKKGHTVVGEEIALRCTVTSQNSVTFKWKREDGIKLDPNRIKYMTPESLTAQELHIKNALLEDAGQYTCQVSDNQQHTTAATVQVKVLGADEYYINITEPNDIRYMVSHVGEEMIQWVVHVDGHPEVIVRWLKNHNETIKMESGSKYEASYNATRKTAVLKIKTIAMSDFGTYTLDAKNSRTEKSMDFFLNVTDKPAVQMKVPRFFPMGKPVKVTCNIAANPPPKIHWELKSCSECSFVPISGHTVDEEGFHFTSETTVLANNSGLLKCSASNLIGTDEEIKPFIVTDVEDGFNLFAYEEDAVLNSTHAIFAEGDRIAFTCGSSYTDHGPIIWLLDGKVLTANEKYVIEKSYTDHSNRSTMNILFGKKEDSGKYTCRIENRDKFLEKDIYVTVTDPIKPVLVQTNMRGGVSETEYPLSYKLICKVFGVPKPQITWYKNDVVFHPSEGRIMELGGNQVLYFNRTDVMDEGTYSCSARNRMGGISAQQVLKFKNIPRYFWLFVVIGFLVVLFIAAIIYIIIKTRREKKLQRELKKIGLANFEKGAVENINPELGIDDQAELLPYDKKWEFPIERLKLGKQLGSGAFGVVMKGEAKNIVDGEPVTTVAVKMVKKNADNTYIKALASELKIMVHLGKHLNVVNLLGACTKNVVKRELMVIVEYCRYGNLQNYLLRHRDNFINQIDPRTGKIDYTIGQEYDLDRSYSVSSNKSNNCYSPSMKYAALTFSNHSGNSILPTQSEMGDYRSSAGTQMTTLPDDGTVLSNNSIQPEWRSNYKGDYKGNVKPICTKDLLAWSFQVARGMEYLASRKVLHGDLAARNILLSDNNIVKICDFGLAKSMYKSDNYKKQGDCPLPIKWMAIESIRDRIFSTQSDVWSFGIVLWELFSLARTPYPGMEADERLYHKLVDGYRMEAPEYSPKEIYRLMSECWLTNPLSRPSFGKLSETLGNLLEDTLRKHYVDLNDPYLAMNTKMIEESSNDYLAMVSPPTFEAIATPNYQNDMVTDQQFEDQGYMSMKPNTIFSPRYDEGQVFDFSPNNRKSLHSEEGGGHELLPMLHPHQGESDTDTPLQSPMAVSNPTYHQLPLAGNIVKTADNYVNMLQNKQIIKDSKKEDIEKPDASYVNSCSRDWEAVV